MSNDPIRPTPTVVRFTDSGKSAKGTPRPFELYRCVWQSCEANQFDEHIYWMLVLKRHPRTRPVHYSMLVSSQNSSAGNLHVYHIPHGPVPIIHAMPQTTWTMVDFSQIPAPMRLWIQDRRIDGKSRERKPPSPFQCQSLLWADQAELEP